MKNTTELNKEGLIKDRRRTKQNLLELTTDVTFVNLSYLVPFRGQNNGPVTRLDVPQPN